MESFAASVEALKLACITATLAGDTSLRALARASGLSQPHLSNWISGRRALSVRAADRIQTAMRRVSGFEKARIDGPNPSNQVG